MFLTPDELKNIIVLCEVGAKSMSADKPLHESANIQATALDLIRKLVKAHEKPPEEPKPD
jgi:hypothetical protein